MNTIPLARPDLGGNEEKYTSEAIRSSWISSTGPFVSRFEHEFATGCGTRSAVSVSNGTAALHLALLALDVQPGDEVIVPSLTFVATANACLYVGAAPVFVDVDPATWCLDADRLAANITPRTRGIIAVHLYGHPADMDAIDTVASTHGLWVVEDAAEAPFATYKGRVAGGLARIGTFSFFGNKIFSSGEGGALTVNDPELDARIRLLRGQGMDPTRRYYFPVTGYNYRLSNVACALLCAQLERRDEMLSRRQLIFARYEQRLRGVTGLGFQSPAPWAVRSPWLFCVVIRPEFGVARDDVATALADAGIETRPFFIPLHTLPPFRDQADARNTTLPVTDRLGAQGLSLPTHTSLTDDQVDFVCEQLLDQRS